VKTVLHTEASPGLGGQEVRTLNEARWTAERGWRVLLAAQPDGRLLDRAREAGVETAAIRMRGPLDPLGLAALVRLIRRERVDLVHTHSSIDAWLGGMAARLCRVPVVRTRHVSIAIRRGVNPVYRWLADRVITSGEAIRQIVIAAGAPAERVIAIPAGVNLEAFPFGRRAPDTARELAAYLRFAATPEDCLSEASLVVLVNTLACYEAVDWSRAADATVLDCWRCLSRSHRTAVGHYLALGDSQPCDLSEWIEGRAGAKFRLITS